jgi:hypothetical protein
VWELASSTAVSSAVDKGDKHTEKASDSLLSRSSSKIASSKSWDRRKGWCGKEEGEEEAKGKVRHKKSLLAHLGSKSAIISNPLALLRPTTSPKGPRLLLFDY